MTDGMNGFPGKKRGQAGDRIGARQSRLVRAARSADRVFHPSRAPSPRSRQFGLATPLRQLPKYFGVAISDLFNGARCHGFPGQDYDH